MLVFVVYNARHIERWLRVNIPVTPMTAIKIGVSPLNGAFFCLDFLEIQLYTDIIQVNLEAIMLGIINVLILFVCSVGVGIAASVGKDLDSLFCMAVFMVAMACLLIQDSLTPALLKNLKDCSLFLSAVTGLLSLPYDGWFRYLILFGFYSILFTIEHKHQTKMQNQSNSYEI